MLPAAVKGRNAENAAARSGGAQRLGRRRNTRRTVIMKIYDGVLSVLACLCTASAVCTKLRTAGEQPGFCYENKQPECALRRLGGNEQL